MAHNPQIHTVYYSSAEERLGCFYIQSCCVAEWDPSAALVKQTQNLTGWNRLVLCVLLHKGLYGFCTVQSRRREDDFAHPVNSQACLLLQEILDEVVRELHKVKDEIINGKQCLWSSLQYPEAQSMFNLLYTLVTTSHWQLNVTILSEMRTWKSLFTTLIIHCNSRFSPHLINDWRVQSLVAL